MGEQLSVFTMAAASSDASEQQPWNNKGQRAAIGQSSGASRVQLYVTMGLFLWIMREQWQMLLCTMLCFLGALWYNQRGLIYMANMPPESRTKFQDPAEMGLEHVEMFLKTPDGESLQFWAFPQGGASGGSGKSKRCPTIVFFHANAGNLSQRLPNIKDLYALGLNVIILSYRGYGKSTGTAYEAGMKIDSQAFLDHIEKDEICRSLFGGTPLVVFGRSIGGAAAIHLTRYNQDRLAGMMVENTFLNLEAMAGVVYPLLRPLLPLMLKDKWWSNRLVGDIALPMLFISSGQDEIVPASQFAELLKLARDGRRKGAGNAAPIELFFCSQWNTQ